MLAINELSSDSPMESYPLEGAARDYERIAMALRAIEGAGTEQPDLSALAAAVGLSPHHFQRLFRRWAGVSPKRFVQALTLTDAKARLAASESVLDAAFGAGLSGPSRLHDLFVACEAMTPGEYKTRGRDAGGRRLNAVKWVRQRWKRTRPVTAGVTLLVRRS